MTAASAIRPASSREVMGFRLALLFVAVAVLDDAFVHPEPGTPLSGQFLSAFVPLAIAGGLAWAYPRLRAGARATTALVCGMLALVAGIADGARHVAVDRLAGDDLTALLAGLAGALLIA